MKDESIRKSLTAIARKSILEDTNLWPRLAARLERKGSFTIQRKWKVVWIILLVLLGLFATTGVAYTFYRYFNDAGMQSVNNAGLVSRVNATALPTRMPTATPPEPVTVIGDSQTLEGVSLTLKWVYLMDGQQAFGFSADGLSDGKTLGMPEMGFGKLVPEQYRGASMALKDETNPVVGTYVVNQIVRDESTFGKTETRTGVSIDIPLLGGNGQVLNTFRFEVKDEVVHEEPFAGGNTYSTRANGLEMSLDWVLLASQTIQARLCFTPPDGKDWALVSPSIQLGADPSQVASATPVTSSQQTTITTKNGIRCQQMTFPVSAADAQAFNLVVRKLATPAGDAITGEWAFTWNQLPNRMQFPGIAPLEAPLASEDIGNDMTVTLEKAYADVNRMVLVVFIDTRQEGFSVSGAALKDIHGAELNAGLGVGSPPGDPTRFIIELHPSPELTAGHFQGELSVEIAPAPGTSSVMAEAHFKLDLTVYPAVVFDPMQTVTANGVKILLQRVKVTPSYAQVYLCYRGPSPADWTVGSATSLQMGGDKASLDAYGLLFDPEMGYRPKIPEPDWVPPIQTGRCVRIGFPVGHHNGPETMTLIIPQLEQAVPEVIPDGQVQAARQKLLAQGIDMDWVITSGNGGGGAGPVITKKPDGMTDEQVMREFYEALGYYYPGPWVFTLQIKP